MKELIPTHIEHLQEAEDQKEYGFMGSMLLKPGLKLYSYDSKADVVEEVNVVRQAQLTLKNNKKLSKPDMDKQAHVKGKADYDPSLIYCQALNVKNARRKGKKIMTEIDRLEQLKIKK